jgi:hypothetical protein
MICKNCGASFSIYVVIDGKPRNLSARRYCLTCSPFNKHNTGKLERERVIGDKRYCIYCGREYVYDRKNGHRRKFCNSCGSNRTRTTTKRKCVEYKGGKCGRCGYSRCLFALDFHHRDPAGKEFNISTWRNCSFETLRKELDKCDLVCRNCHAEIHEDEEEMSKMLIRGRVAQMALERVSDTDEAAGSIPVPPTIFGANTPVEDNRTLNSETSVRF